MPGRRRELGTVQRWMQAVITHPGGVRAGMAASEARREMAVGPDEVESVVTRSRALSGLDRLEIYARAYFARLLECLRAEFPVLARAMGEDLFDEFAVGYLERYPSRTYTLNRLGADFARYLAETRPPDEDWPDLLIDLATLEWAVAEVFDGPGVEGQALLEVGGLTAIPVERWAEARLVPVPCLRVLALDHPVRAYYTALRDGKEAMPPDRSDSYMALTRRDYVVRIHDLAPPEYVLLNALLDGQPIGSAVGLVAESADPELDHLADDLRVWFGNWAAAGFFRAVEVP